MCGITGIWYLTQKFAAKEEITSFNTALAHRGPDGFGFYHCESENLSLGHRRLSILDLSDKGKQPMSALENRYTITFNGEVFNFLELRNELQQLGWSFQSDTDTEVILAGYIQWGKQAFPKFNGMWALAIWDQREKELILCRDRFGIKPLFFIDKAEIFAFASETIAFKNLKGFSREWNTKHVKAQLQNFTSLEARGLSLFKDIYQLPAGHFLIKKPNTPAKSIRWWSTQENLPKPAQHFEEQAKEFLALFEDSCRLRLRSDVPIATALSGGLDSSSVYSMLQYGKAKNTHWERTPANWQRAFCAIFPGTSVDELEFAEQVVNKYQGDLTTINALNVPDLESDILKSVQLFDNFYLTPINVIGQIYQRMREEGFVVSMDGHGVDEMLFGYNADILELYKTAMLQGDLPYAKEVADTYVNLFPPAEHQIARQNLEGIPAGSKSVQNVKRGLKEALNKFGLYNSKEPNTIEIKDVWLSDLHSSINLSTPYLQTDKLSSDPYADLMYRQFHSGILPVILRNFDRASMQHGVEIRMPFMDYRLVSYVMSLPQHSKLGNGYSKQIVREAMKGILPESIRTRTFKMSIQAPMHDWLGGTLKSFSMDAIRSQSFLNSEIWEGKSIAHEVEENFESNAWDFQGSAKLWHYLNAYLLMEASEG
ncbi:asparagine synthase (glutamine-hydrolyzing) [Fulvivirgaceae bacterium LMO-SS25]